jgi:hypothetical protein
MNNATIAQPVLPDLDGRLAVDDLDHVPAFVPPVPAPVPATQERPVPVTSPRPLPLGVVLVGWRCRCCAHEWHPRQMSLPRQCPRCRSRRWDRMPLTVR